MENNQAWIGFAVRGVRISPVPSHILSEMLLLISIAGLSRDLLLLLQTRHRRVTRLLGRV